MLLNEYKNIVALLELLREPKLDAVQNNPAVWDIIHANMNEPGVLPVPFKRSLDEYDKWSEVEGGRHEFAKWIKSILYAVGHRWYDETKTKDGIIIHIPGFLNIHTDAERGIKEIERVKDLDPYMFDCGVDLWYDVLPVIAIQANIDLEQLRYELAMNNTVDQVFFEGARWMPDQIKRAIRLAAAEGFTLEEIADDGYMDDKYQIWLEQGLI